MKITHKPIQVSFARWCFALATLGAWTAFTILLGRAGGWAAILAGPLYAIPLISLGEWLTHGVLYHGRVPGMKRIQTIHHAGHHFALFPPDHYVQNGRFEFMRVRAPLIPFRMADSAVDDKLTEWGQIALHFVVGIPLLLVPAWALSRDATFFGSVLVTLALISWLLAYVHGVIHTPRDRAIEHMRWFQWLDRHHYIHHIDLSANINFLLPICDVLFGTQKAALTPAEAQANPSFEEAKPMAKDIPRPEPSAGKVAA
jgi:hypothetical protein